MAIDWPPEFKRDYLALRQQVRELHLRFNAGQSPPPRTDADAFWVRIEGNETGTGVYFGRRLFCLAPIRALGADTSVWVPYGDEIVIYNFYEGASGSGHSLTDSPQQLDHPATWASYTNDSEEGMTPRRLALIAGISFNDCDSEIDGNNISLLLARGAGAPATLAEGEPAVDTTNKRLYYGDGSQNFLVARAWNVTAVQTTTYAAAVWDLVRCDPSGGGFTVNLPTAASRGGEGVVVKNTTTSTNAITVDGNGAETIDGAATATINTSRGVLRLASDGTNWLSL